MVHPLEGGANKHVLIDFIKVVEPKLTSGCSIQLREVNYFNKDLVTQIGKIPESCVPA